MRSTTGQAQYAVGDYGAVNSGAWTTATTWKTWNGIAWTGSGVPPATANVWILTGSTVAITCGGGPVNVNNLVVEAGGKLWSNDCVTNSYVYINGSTLTCNGQIGDGSTFDGISFGIEGANVTISGSGQFDTSRMRKNLNAPNATTNLTIAMNVTLRFTGGTTTQIYNSANASVFNVTLNAGCTLTLIGTGGQGNIAMDGTNGNDPSNRGGSYTINGTVIASGTLYLTTNNTANPCGFTINNGGLVRVNSIDMTASGSAGHTLTINSGGKLEVQGTPTAWNAISTTNNPCNLNAGSTFEYSGAGPQNVEGGISGGYGGLRISGTGTKAVNGALIVKGDLDIVNSSGTPTLDVTIANYAISIAGNWNNYAATAFNERFGQVTFNGTGAQSINTAGGEVFYNLRNGKSAGTTLTMNCNVTVANQLTFLNGLLDLNSRRLTLSNSATNAVTGGTAARYIISEDVDNSSVVQWNIGATTGAHLIPFGRTGVFIPFTFDLTAGNAGNVSVSTYGTAADNLPWPATPTPVNNLNSVIGLTPDNRDATVDRYWQVDPSGSPTATLTFTYMASELPIAPYNTPLAMSAQRYENSVDRWQPASLGQVSASYSASAPGVTAFGPWTLAANSSPLPIELLAFTATPVAESVMLEWSTASERDNDHFTLYRAADGEHFEEIARVPGAINSQSQRNYAWNDAAPLEGVSFYRLRQTDIDGRWSDAPLVMVDRSANSAWADATPFPNPAMNAVSIHLPLHGDMQAWVSDATGKRVLEMTIQALETTATADVGMLPDGAYLLTLVEANAVHSYRFLVGGGR